MSILDDAIREHLELKRAHGADEGELKKLEDEAFGPPQRPDEVDPFAEAPTEFLLAPDEAAASVPEIADETARSGRRPDIADLQEAPPTEPVTGETDAPAVEGEEELSPAPDAPPPSPTDAADVPLPPPPVDEAPDTDERHAIADQPTQMFDVQAEMAADAPATPAEQESPSDEQLVDAAQSEPQAAPPAPEEPAGPPTELYEQPPLDTRGPDAEVAGHPPTEEESAEFDFFNEQRLSDELDQALEAPLPPTDEHSLPEYQDGGAQGSVFDYEEDPSEEVLRRHDAPEPPSEEAPRDAAEPDSEESEVDYDPDTGHEDVLEDTPRFLEDAPEDDDLWFEQKPPKDFDLD
ncbi:MAG TPA: hypothetical protein VN522_10490 [Solirubrobacterales bacterium]|nr:hypothetical protein [Solirubrobacterales bacterium]